MSSPAELRALVQDARDELYTVTRYALPDDPIDAGHLTAALAQLDSYLKVVRGCKRECGECRQCDRAADERAGVDPHCIRCGRLGGAGGGLCAQCADADSEDQRAHEMAHAPGRV